jgi:hypothetical protein
MPVPPHDSTEVTLEHSPRKLLPLPRIAAADSLQKFLTILITIPVLHTDNAAQQTIFMNMHYTHIINPLQAALC